MFAVSLITNTMGRDIMFYVAARTKRGQNPDMPHAKCILKNGEYQIDSKYKCLDSYAPNKDIGAWTWVLARALGLSIKEEPILNSSSCTPLFFTQAEWKDAIVRLAGSAGHPWQGNFWVEYRRDFKEYLSTESYGDKLLSSEIYRELHEWVDSFIQVLSLCTHKSQMIVIEVD